MDANPESEQIIFGFYVPTGQRTIAKRENLVGWVHPSTQSNLPALADEIARLSKENAQLRSQLTNGNQEDKINGLSYVELKRVLEENGSADFLSYNRYDLNTQHGLPIPNSSSNQQTAKELCLRGLLAVNLRIGSGSHVYYLMTASGRAYLNKFEAEQLNLRKNKINLMRKVCLNIDNRLCLPIPLQ
jgi:hypothetical protein